MLGNYVTDSAFFDITYWMGCIVFGLWAVYVLAGSVGLVVLPKEDLFKRPLATALVLALVSIGLGLAHSSHTGLSLLLIGIGWLSLGVYGLRARRSRRSRGLMAMYGVSAFWGLLVISVALLEMT